MFPNDYFAERERWDTQVAENSARGAWAWGNVHTKGWGQMVLPEPIMFGVTFTEQPFVSYGFALDDDEQLVEDRYPRCSGGVLRWVKTTEDFYVGAYVIITVATADPMLAAQAWVDASLSETGTTLPDSYKSDPSYDLTHSFTFQAMAIKDVIE